jgi:predicted SprT family Zn-dependent metalloprotease
MRICSCGRPTLSPTSGYCKACHAAYMREWRKRQHMAPDTYWCSRCDVLVRLPSSGVAHRC